MNVKLTISRKGIEELFCVVNHPERSELLALKPEYSNLKKNIHYWGLGNYNYFIDSDLFYNRDFKDVEIIHNEVVLGKYVEDDEVVLGKYVEDDEEMIFSFPDNYPEEDLFYFKLKYC